MSRPLRIKPNPCGPDVANGSHGPFGPGGPTVRRNTLETMAWFLRAIELPGGSWACRWSHQELDTHPTLDDALSHLREFATTLGPAEFFVHQLDGQVTRLGDTHGSS